MAPDFWNERGIILFRFLPKKTTDRTQTTMLEQ
jgi:hypothetical protein